MSRVALEQAARADARHVLAALVRRFGDFDAAEDALQEALLAASRQWPSEGVPDNSRAWLVTVASRRLVDGLRAARTRTARERRAVERTAPPPMPAADELPAGAADDTLVVLLLCCHPAVPPASRVALTLRAVAGLTTAQIARAFLVPESTMAQRISRAKTRLREVGARFDELPADELALRLAAVAQVIYLIFTEGHTTSSGPTLCDVVLSDEAIRLGRQLHARLPGDGEVAGLLALMLLTDARRDTRVDGGGLLVPLADQDRSRWDPARIREGVALVERALPVGPVGPYQLQAAIAAVHSETTDAAATDWRQIEVLYRMLAGVTPGPMVTLNHAVAVGMVDGPAAGLRLLEPLLADRRLRRHHRLHAVRAHFLVKLGRPEEARLAFATAAALTTSIPEQRYLNDRAAETAPAR